MENHSILGTKVHNWRLCAECLRVTTLEQCECHGETCNCPSCLGNIIAMLGGIRDMDFLFGDGDCGTTTFSKPSKWPKEFVNWCPDCGYRDVTHTLDDPNFAFQAALHLWSRDRITGDAGFDILYEIVVNRDEDDHPVG